MGTFHPSDIFQSEGHILYVRVNCPEHDCIDNAYICFYEWPTTGLSTQANYTLSDAFPCKMA